MDTRSEDAGPSPTTGPRTDTARRYLDVAAELARVDAAHEPADVHAVSHIRLTDVARRSAIPRSSLYRLWDTQHDFWKDLVVFILTRGTPWLDDAGAVEDPPIEPGDEASLLEHVRVHFNHAQERLLRDPRLVLRATLMGFPRTPAVADAALSWERAERSRLAARLTTILAAARRAPIAPLDTQDLAALIWLMADGTALLASADPSYAGTRLSPDDGTSGADGWSLTAFAARCLLIELTAPTDLDTPPPSDSPGEALRPSPSRWSATQVSALDAGADLFAESIDLAAPTEPRRPAGVLGHVTMARVARAAGVSRRQLYNVWPTHDELCHALIRHICDRDYEDHYARFDEAMALAPLDPGAPSLTMAVAEHMYRTRVLPRPGEDLGDPPLKLALEAHNGDSVVRDENRSAIRTIEADDRRRIASLADLSGARTRPGLTMADLARMLVVAAKGAVTLRHGDPASVRASVPYAGGHWSTFAIGHHAIVEHMVIRPTGGSS